MNDFENYKAFYIVEYMGVLSKKLRAKMATIKDIKTLDYSPESNGVIVSLTTVPSRINYIKPTIMSLLRQTYKADRIELNLGKTVRKKDIPWEIPPYLKSLKALKIFWIEQDLGPATKSIPALKRHIKDNALIIVVDDDMLYPKNLIESFVMADKESRENTVFCAGGNLLNKNLNMNDLPPKKRQKKGKKRVAIIEGCGGYCLRANYFNMDAFTKEEGAPEGAFTMDDIWISGHLSRCNIKKYQIPTGKRNSLPQTTQPAIVEPRTEISNKLLRYFYPDWKEEEYI